MVSVHLYYSFNLQFYFKNMAVILRLYFFQSHTILLVQPGPRPETRTYSDYESVNDCMEGVCKIYEEHLKRRNPNTPTITYDISQLFDFVDQVNKIVFLTCCTLRHNHHGILSWIVKHIMNEFENFMPCLLLSNNKL